MKVTSPTDHFRTREHICPNCLMTQAKARALTSGDNVWECGTIGGCGGRFTDGYLAKTNHATMRILQALGLAQKPVIEKGSAAEEREQVILTGHRNVRLPDEEPTDG